MPTSLPFCSKRPNLLTPSADFTALQCGKAKLACFTMLLLLLASCDNNPERSQTSSQVNTDQKESVASENVEPQTKTPLTSENELAGAEKEPLAGKGKEPLAAVDEVPLATLDKEPSASSDKLPAQENDPTSLIEDLGFSGTAQSGEAIDSPKQALYCLSDQEQAISNDVCRQISTRLSSVKLKACNAARLQASGCQSVKGFPILVREFPPLKDRLPKGRILIIGGTHGDELTSVSVSLRWIEKLNQYHSGLYHWHIAPLMNPDGVLKPSASRTNYNGVDLNRNMPSDDWAEKALKYWDQKGGKDPRKFPGDKPASEPETQWLIDEINTFKPDAIVSVHAPYGVVDFDSLLLNTAPKSLGKLRLNLLGTYPGSLGNYAGINRNIPVITLELPHSWIMPSEKETSKIWEDLVSWLKKNINNELASATN